MADHSPTPTTTTNGQVQRPRSGHGQARPAGQLRRDRPGHTLTTVTDKLSNDRAGPADRAGVALRLRRGVHHALDAAWWRSIYLFIWGVGIWGINVPVAWGFAIVNFVWWIGIGHAGTLISAILLLLKQEWRTSINRFAEAMTLFAVACAGMFPLLAPGPALAVLLALAVPEHDGALAAVAQPAGLGRVRGLHLRHRLAAVLVRRPDPRPGDAAGPHEVEGRRHDLRRSSRWAGGARRGTGTAIGRRTCCWPGWRRRWWSRCTRS